MIAFLLAFMLVAQENVQGEGISTPDSLRKQIEKLFEDASLWQVGENREKVSKAREELVKIGEPVLDYIFEEKINTDRTLELRAIKHVVKKLRDDARKYILENLTSENDTVRRNCIWLLGEIKDTSSVDTLLRLLQSEKNYKFIARIITALGKIGDTTATVHIMPFMEHEKEVVRISCAEALGKIGDPRATGSLIEGLGDPLFTVRYTSTWALSKIGREAIDSLISRAESVKDTVFLVQAVITLRDIVRKDTLDFEDSLKVRLFLRKFLDSPSWVLRGYAREAFGLAGSEGARYILLQAYEFEENPFVRRRIEDALNLK